jgi:chromosome segregation ATPase
MNKIDELTARLQEAQADQRAKEARQETLQAELNALSLELSEKNRALEQVIIGAGDPATIEGEIGQLKTRLVSLAAALKALPGEVEAARELEKSLKVEIALERGQALSDDILARAGNLHERLSELLADVEALQIKTREYGIALRPLPQERWPGGYKVNSLGDVAYRLRDDLRRAIANLSGYVGK